MSMPIICTLRYILQFNLLHCSLRPVLMKGLFQCIFSVLDYNNKFVMVWWSASSSCLRTLGINKPCYNLLESKSLSLLATFVVSTLLMKPFLNINPFVRILSNFSLFFSRIEQGVMELLVSLKSSVHYSIETTIIEKSFIQKILVFRKLPGPKLKTLK